jgi:hypothetical protein
MPRHHEVPTHLNVEDKVLFGLTVGQFLQVLVGTSASYTLWDQTVALAEPARIALVATSVCLTLGFALVRPGGRAPEEWLVAVLIFVGSPRRSTWQPTAPDPADWRPAGGGWHELAPSVSWAEEELECA